MKDIIIDYKNCYETHPCKHEVTILYENNYYKVTKLNGERIYEILEHLGKEIPEHFQYYKYQYKYSSLFDNINC